MDATQTKIIELLREVHLLAIREVERLNLRIAELENQQGQTTVAAIPKPAVTPGALKAASPKTPEMLNEHQAAEYLNMSLGSLRRWRLFSKGPKFIKIGRAVWYSRRDLET